MGGSSWLHKLLPLGEARRIALETEFSEPPREEVPVYRAAWRIVASPVIAERDVPETPMAAMDGYALRSSDLASMGRLRVVGSVRRGSTPPPLGEGEAVEIETGAPLPPGADAVVRREASRVIGGFLSTSEKAWPGKDVFRRGEFVRKGQILARRGQIVSPYLVPLLIQAGVDSVEVYRVRVAIVVAGRVSPTTAPSLGGRVERDYVAPMLAAMMPWAETSIIGPLEAGGVDELRGAIRLASRTSDIVVTVGGASVGGGDVVKQAVSEEGEVLVPGVSVSVIKRGGLGRVKGRLVSMLPGQCVSAATAAHEFLLRPMRGVTGASLVRSTVARLARDVEVARRMDTLYLVSLEGGEAEPLEWGVALCRELARADGYAILKRGRHGRGELVEVTLFSMR